MFYFLIRVRGAKHACSYVLKPMIQFILLPFLQVLT